MEGAFQKKILKTWKFLKRFRKALAFVALLEKESGRNSCSKGFIKQCWKIFAKLTGKTLHRTLCRSTACNYFKKRINQKFFRAYFRNFIQKTFFQSTSWGLLHFAYISIVCICIYKYVEISLSAKLFIDPNKYTNLKGCLKTKTFSPLSHTVY